MRISDWSSDVCSSDLNGEGSAVANNPVRIWEDQWMHHRPAVISRMAARLGRCTRIHGRETVVQRVDSNTGLQFLEANHLLVPLKGKYRFGLRSEEHTSELQSLMRNSYAVFCLIKKKTATTT